MAGLISNGSFVLSDPNTRDLYLGKGLKDGFEGDKYYIAADETVLWEGEGSNVAILSEPLSNFEYFKIYVGFESAPKANEFSTQKLEQINVSFNSESANVYRCEVYIAYDDTSKTLTATKSMQTKMTYSTSSTITYSVDTVLNCMFRVVGINRKREEV